VDDPSTDEHLTAMSPQRLMTPTVDHNSRHPTRTTADDTVDVTGDVAVSLVYHSSDFAITPVAEAAKVRFCNTVLSVLLLLLQIDYSQTRSTASL